MEPSRRRARNLAWGLSWLAYATYYVGRKGFSVAKKSLHDRLGVSAATLGGIESAYLAAYAGGQFLNGWLGDRVGARRLVGFGMLLSSGCCAGFGMASTAVVFGLLFFINGYAQSSGWPGTTRAMAEWTTPSNRGTVMAFWATCYQVGGIAASWIAGWLLGSYGWRAAFLVPALMLAAVGVLVLGLLEVGPGAQDANRDSDSAKSGPGDDSGAEPPAHAEPNRKTDALRRAAQRGVIRSPVVWSYGASYFFIKFIRYTLLFWLPFYLSQQLGYAEDHAAYVSTAFEAGGIAGVVVIGIGSDRLRRYPRSALAALGLLGMSLSLYACSALSGLGVGVTILCLALVGAFLFGPDSLICGAAAQDAGGPYAAATATGFVNGVGSVGAILEGTVVPRLTERYGWDALFPMLVGMGVLAALALLPVRGRVRSPAAEEQ